MVPADEGFDSEQFAGLERDLRLIEEDELLVRDGKAQLLLGAEPLTASRPMVLSDSSNRPPPRSLDWCMAASALRMSMSRLVWGSDATATPTLIELRTS
jgi:hypothetical protein